MSLLCEPLWPRALSVYSAKQLLPLFTGFHPTVYITETFQCFAKEINLSDEDVLTGRVHST